MPESTFREMTAEHLGEDADDTDLDTFVEACEQREVTVRDEMPSYKPLQRLLDCFLILHPSEAADAKPTVVLTRLPTLKQLQAVEEMVGALVYREQRDSLDRPLR